MTQHKLPPHFPFAEGDEWKKAGVVRGLEEINRRESAKRKERVQECVRWFLDAKENSAHNK